MSIRELIDFLMEIFEMLAEIFGGAFGGEEAEGEDAEAQA